MGISTSLVFGIPLTGDFGDRLPDVDPAVWAYAFVDHHASDDDEFSDPYENYKPGVVFNSTAEDVALLMGIPIGGGDLYSDSGLDLGNADQVQAVYDNYLAVMAALPEEVKHGLDKMGRTPKVCILAGHS